MRFGIPSILSAVIAARFVLAADIRGSIGFTQFLPNASSIAPSSRILIDHGARQVYIRHDGTFEITDLSEGRHYLEPLIPGYTFLPYLITVSPESTTPPHIQIHHPNRLALPITTPSLPYPLTLKPLHRDIYFTPPPSMQIVGMLKNPMILMMIFSAVMMFALPKLTAGLEMDDDMKKDMADARKKMRGIQSMDFMDTLSGALTGSTDKVDGAATASVPSKAVPVTPSSGGTAGSGAGARRRKGK